MNKAIIDLGTNTFNLLIFNNQNQTPNIIFNDKIPVGLGLGGINNKIITFKAIERGLNAIKSFKKTCDEHQVNEVFAFGTSALRDATNSNDFLEAVKIATNIDIKIISGEQEANYIYQGVAHQYNCPSDFCIMDIGGGSTEIIDVRQKKIHNFGSHNIGIARILGLFSLEDPLSKNNISDILQYFETTTKGALDKIKREVLIGASGSFETYYELIHKIPISPNKQLSIIELKTDDLSQILETLIHSDYAWRKNNARIVSLREKMIHLAALKTKWVMEKIGAKKVFLSPSSLKEGVMWELLEN